MRIVRRFRMRHRLPGGLADLVHTFYDDNNGGGEYIEDTSTGEWWWTASDSSYYQGDQYGWEGTDASGKYFYGTAAKRPAGVPDPNKDKPKNTNWNSYLLIGGAALLAVAMLSKRK
jgi:hypothetical protein